MSRDPRNEARLAKNEESLNKATHHREVWEADELALLLTWDQTNAELEVMAEILGRTIEACRQRFYDVKAGRKPGPGIKVTRVTKAKPTTVTRGIGDNRITTAGPAPYLGAADDDEDQWWTSGYYTKEK